MVIVDRRGGGLGGYTFTFVIILTVTEQNKTTNIIQ
jgi:hypothetical protein